MDRATQGRGGNGRTTDADGRVKSGAERHSAATAGIVSRPSPGGPWMSPVADLVAGGPVSERERDYAAFRARVWVPGARERALPTAVLATDLLNSIVASFARFTDRWSDNPLRRFETEEWSDLIGY